MNRAQLLEKAVLELTSRLNFALAGVRGAGAHSVDPANGVIRVMMPLLGGDWVVLHCVAVVDVNDTQALGTVIDPTP